MRADTGRCCARPSRARSAISVRQESNVPSNWNLRQDVIGGKRSPVCTDAQEVIMVSIGNFIVKIGYLAGVEMYILEKDRTPPMPPWDH
jgi:hypothetical protein